MFSIIGNSAQCNFQILKFCDFIYLLSLTVEKSSFLQNVVQEIRPGTGCRNLQRPQIMVNLSEVFLGGMMLEVHSDVLV